MGMYIGDRRWWFGAQTYCSFERINVHIGLCIWYMGSSEFIAKWCSFWHYFTAKLLIGLKLHV